MTKSFLRNGTILLALVGGIGFAAAQTSPSAPGGAKPPSSTMTPGAPGAKLQLSAAQKTAIFKAVSAEPTKPAAQTSVRISLGTQLPGSIELHALPASVVAQVPATQDFRYTMVQSDVVLVDPTTMRVVEIIRQ